MECAYVISVMIKTNQFAIEDYHSKLMYSWPASHMTLALSSYSIVHIKQKLSVKRGGGVKIGFFQYVPK